MDFGLKEEQKMLKEILRRFAKNEWSRSGIGRYQHDTRAYL